MVVYWDFYDDWKSNVSCSIKQAEWEDVSSVPLPHIFKNIDISLFKKYTCVEPDFSGGITVTMVSSLGLALI